MGPIGFSFEGRRSGSGGREGAESVFVEREGGREGGCEVRDEDEPRSRN